MKRKIIVFLGSLFLVFGTGAAITALSLKSTSSLFDTLLKNQEIDDLRHTLVEKILKVQSDLHTVHTPFGSRLEEIVDNVDSLEQAARQCTGCHHQAAIDQNLLELQQQVGRFKNALSFYITASANRERIELLKGEATVLGNAIVATAEQMSFEAKRKGSHATNRAIQRNEHAGILLAMVIAASCLLGILIAVHLTRAITVPVSDLVRGTRIIAAGELGYTLGDRYPAEFGELAEHFNSMSLSLKQGYEKLQREILERQETAEALRQSEERYALAARGANDGLWDWDLGNNSIYFSPRWKAMHGYAEEALGNSPEDWLRLVHPDDRGRLLAKIAAHIEGRTPHLEDEHRAQHRDGAWRWMLVRGIVERDADAKAYRMAGSQTDISERKKAEEQLVHDAFHDALTRLPNRALFMDRLEQVLKMAKRYQDFRFAVLFLDLDRFKYVNDSLGHLIGDQFLIAVGQRLSGYLRPSDTVARLGGDEFAILLEEITEEADAIKVAHRIKSELPQPLQIDGHELFPSASIGIALSSPHYERPEELLRDADLAMYQAKANGKGRFEVFNSAMYASTIRHLRLETDLRRAIDRQEFHLAYQPIVALSTDTMIGVEALIRWEHPLLGEIDPSEFIPLAEETGMITSIGLWVLREACRQAGLWQKRFPAFPLTVNVNLSSREFTPGLIEEIKEIFAETAVDPSTLCLEITEGTLMGHPQSASQLLCDLKALGIGLHIDDFGTGYSSLSYLHSFPIDTLKIDRSFIHRINSKKEHFEIVKTIISLAKTLEMEIVAEGVETAEELMTVRELGCALVQGYFFHRPMKPQEIEALMGAETGAAPIAGRRGA